MRNVAKEMKCNMTYGEKYFSSLRPESNPKVLIII